MLRKKRVEVKDKEDNKRELEIMKAVAQAWYSHGGSSRPLNEFDARKNSFRGRWPSRFKLEAMKKKTSTSSSTTAPSNYYNKSGAHETSSWDFGQSLWDSYEIVTVSKRLETGLVLDTSFSEIDDSDNRVSVSSAKLHSNKRSTKESKNSLRNLFNQMSSRRFVEPKQNSGL